jgi:hypothetical protein
MKKILASLLLALAFCGVSHAQVSQSQPFAPCNVTVTVTAATSAPSPVQAQCGTSFSNTQYLITNIGSVPAFVTYSGTSALATTNCVIPTSTPTAVYVILPLSQIVITAGGGSWFCALTSTSTAVIYITPGSGS